MKRIYSANLELHAVFTVGVRGCALIGNLCRYTTCVGYTAISHEALHVVVCDRHFMGACERSDHLQTSDCVTAQYVAPDTAVAGSKVSDRVLGYLATVYYIVYSSEFIASQESGGFWTFVETIKDLYSKGLSDGGTYADLAAA